MDWARFGGTSHHPTVSTMFIWAKFSLHSKLRCLMPFGGNDPSAVGIVPSTALSQALLGSGLALPNDRDATAAQRWGSLLQQLWGGWGQRWGAGIPPLMFSLCSSLLDIINARPSTTAASRVALSSPMGMSVFHILMWLCAAHLSPRTSCGRSRNRAGREAELRSRPAPLLLQLGKLGKS